MTHWWKNSRCILLLCSYLSTKQRGKTAQKETFVLHQRNLKCAFSSSNELAGYQATVASLSSILIRALNNRIRTNLSIPIWYRCVSSWADDAGQAVTVLSNHHSRWYWPSDDYFRWFAVAKSSHSSRHPRQQFAIVSVADVPIVRYGE